LAKLAAVGIQVSPGRIVDLTLAGARYDVMKGALDILLQAPEFDLVVAVVGSSARLQPELAVKPIIDSAGSAKPLVAMLVPEAPQAIAQLTAAGVPCFRSPESCADVITALFNRRSPLDLLEPTWDADEAGLATPPVNLNEAQAYELLDQLGVPHAAYLTLPLQSAVAPALPFDFPVVVKVCSADIPHKTEVGGVLLNIRDGASLNAALATLRSNLAERAPGVPAELALVQPMRLGLAEVLVGYRIDPDAGPLIMLAAGGIWTDLLRDRSIRLAPVSVATAEEMIGEVRALKILTGLRGKPRGDLKALAEAISALSQLAIQPEHGVLEAEVNPLMIMGEGQGVLAVDALILKR
jgi:acyl-CoA synthetase (NDP forming)